MITDLKLIYSSEGELVMASIIINNESHTTGDVRTALGVEPCAVFSKSTNDKNKLSLGKVVEDCKEIGYKIIPTKIKDTFQKIENGYIYIYF
jgi:hypothetical protein